MSGREEESGSKSDGSIDDNGTNKKPPSKEKTVEDPGESLSTDGASTIDLPADVQRQQEVCAEVEALVRLVVLEETGNVDAMLTQFKRREEELLQTLRTMQERSVTARTRAAVARGRGRPVPPPCRDYNSTGSVSRSFSVSSRQTGGSSSSAWALLTRDFDAGVSSKVKLGISVCSRRQRNGDRNTNNKPKRSSMAMDLPNVSVVVGVGVSR